MFDRLTGQAQNPATMPMRDVPMTPQPMSEMQYAAQAADDALRTLEKAVHELVGRLEPVLGAEPSSPVQQEIGSARAVTSRMATALYTHAQQTEQLTRIVANALNRLAL